MEKINKIQKLKIPKIKGKKFEDYIEYYNNIMTNYENIIDNEQTEEIKSIEIKTMFTNQTYSQSSIKIKDGKINNKYPYYTIHVLDDGIYGIKEKTKDKILLDNDEEILINPIDIRNENYKKI